MPTQPRSEQVIFPNAGSITVENSNINNTVNNITNVRATLPHAFYDRVLVSARVNADRDDIPSRCLYGTRAGIIRDIESWINGTDGSTHGRQILWLTAPAGSGKSTIMQSLAELLHRRQHPAASFFCQRVGIDESDGSMIMTFIYQLVIHPGHLDTDDEAYNFIASAFDKNQLIITERVESQFTFLFQQLIAHISPAKPVVFLIDGLDECPESMKKQQMMFIDLLQTCLGSDLPVKFVFASRQEPYLKAAFDRHGDAVRKISLDDEPYISEARSDIKTFAEGELNRIKGDPESVEADLQGWPPAGVVDDLVSKSSGNFLYAAGVMSAVAQPGGNPVDTLMAFSNGTASHTKFAKMDVVYTSVFSAGQYDRDKVRDVISGELLLQSIPDDHYTLRDCLHPLGTLVETVYRDILPLLPIMKYIRAQERLFFSHADLKDFLVDEKRSGTFHIDMNAFANKLVVAVFQKGLLSGEPNRFRFVCLVLGRVKDALPGLADCLLLCPEDADFASYHVIFEEDGCVLFVEFLSHMKTLLIVKEHKRFVVLLEKWLKWSVPLLGDLTTSMPTMLTQYGIDHGPDIWARIQKKKRRRASWWKSLRLVVICVRGFDR